MSRFRTCIAALAALAAATNANALPPSLGISRLPTFTTPPAYLPPTSLPTFTPPPTFRPTFAPAPVPAIPFRNLLPADSTPAVRPQPAAPTFTPVVDIGGGSQTKPTPASQVTTTTPPAALRLNGNFAQSHQAGQTANTFGAGAELGVRSDDGTKALSLLGDLSKTTRPGLPDIDAQRLTLQAVALLGRVSLGLSGNLEKQSAGGVSQSGESVKVEVAVPLGTPPQAVPAKPGE